MNATFGFDAYGNQVKGILAPPDIHKPGRAIDSKDYLYKSANEYAGEKGWIAIEWV